MKRLDGRWQSATVVALALLAVLMSAPVNAEVCGQSTCDIVGTSGNDSLSAANAGDVVCGLGGDDDLYGLSGSKEKLCGQGGSDYLEGNTGGDALWGGPGESSPDTIWGEYYIPSFYPQPSGDDLILGHGGNDTIYAQGGADTVWGGTGADFISGMDGDDDLNGQDGNDDIYGGAGTDTIDGGADWDECYDGEVVSNCEVT